MSGVLEQAGAAREPSQYAALTMDRAITGMWTQRSALRDAAVPYVYGKFYSASRFDSIIDGVNRELTSKLTVGRRAGLSVYNSNNFPAINSLYSWNKVVNGQESVRVIADGVDGVIYDATAGGKTTIFTKSGGAGKARFQSVNSALYFCDGVENKKYLQPGGWLANTSIATTKYLIGTTVIDTNKKIQYLISFQVGNITSVQVASNVATMIFNNTNFTLQAGMSFSPAGLSGASFLNGQRLIATSVIPSGATYIVTAVVIHIPYATTADTGTATTTDVGTPATTGGSAPSWAAGTGGSTTDGLSTWKNFGIPLFDWGPPPAPTLAPTLGQVGSGAIFFWKPHSAYGGQFIVDSAGFIQQGFSIVVGGVDGVTGSVLPTFSHIYPGGPGTGNFSVQDGGVTWFCCGTLSTIWLGSTAFLGGFGGATIVDTNGNLQQCAVSGTTGGTVPVWNTALAGTTTDGGATWINKGPVLALSFRGCKYGYAYHCIDGSVSTLSDLSPSTNGLLAGALVGGVGSGDATCDSVWVFRTVDNGSIPLYLASIPNPGAGAFWSFTDRNSDFFLNAFIVGPQANSNNPPPVGMTAPFYHLGRMWAIYQNTVICSGGPNTLVGNGNTAFPGTTFPIPEQPVRLVATMTTAGPALMIWGMANRWLILGTGTTGDPFRQAAHYDSVGILNYDAVAQVGSTFYAFEVAGLIDGKPVGCLASCDPGGGYTEVGFAIGDQFANVTTGAGGREPNSGVPLGALYDPSTTFVTFARLSSGDTGVYVSDGSVGWFRLSPIASPESGYLWSPRAVIVGGTSAVQAIETQPGITQLLVGPSVAEAPGPILFRDETVNADWFDGVYEPFPSYDVKGCIQLCLSGEVAEIAHVHLVSAAVGARPSVGLLFGEIEASTAAPFAWYDRTSTDPPLLAESVSVFSDRYTMLSKSVTPKCIFFQLGMDYGIQAAPDETLLFSVFGAKSAERRDQ